MAEVLGSPKVSQAPLVPPIKNPKLVLGFFIGKINSGLERDCMSATPGTLAPERLKGVGVNAAKVLFFCH